VPVDKAISLPLFGVAQKRADKGLGSKFASQVVWDVHEGMIAESAEL
jgi:hypothetical protein